MALLCVLGPATAHADTGSEPRDDITRTTALDAQLRRALRDRSYILVEADDGTAYVWLLSRGSGPGMETWQATQDDDPDLGVLVQALADPDPDVRVDAVLDLGDIGSTTALALVSQSIHDSSPAVRDAATAVLENLGETDYLPPDRPTE